MRRLPLFFLSLNLCALPALAQETVKPPEKDADKKDETTVVTVTAKKAAVVHKIDSTVYNTGDSPAAQSGTAADVLNTVPSVNVTPDGDVTLRGSGKVQVYINGKPSAMMQGDNRAATLQSMAGSDIASVEVITNPSAKYDANGGSIINLVMKTDRKPGANATIIANVGNDDRRNFSLSGNYNSGKVNLSARIGVRSDAAKVVRSNNSLWQNAADGTTGRNTSAAAYLARRRSLNGQVTVEYTPNATDSLTLELTGKHRLSNNHTQEFRQDFAGEDQPIRDYAIRKTGPNQQDDAHIQTSFIRNADAGDQIKLMASHSVTINRNDRTLRNVFTAPVQDDTLEHYIGKTVSQTDEISGDYNHPYGDTQEMAAGFDWRSDNNRFNNGKNNIDPLTGDETVDPRLTNRFFITQRIYAAYVTWQGRAGKWQFQPGARLEGVLTRGSQITSAMQTRSHFENLAPTLHLAYILSGEDRWKMSYSRSLERPDARDLNPFVTYYDPQNLNSGNPDLKPQTVSSVEGGFEHSHGDNSWSATAYYRESQRTITDYSYFLSADILLTTKRNAGSGRSSGVEYESSGAWGEKWKYSLSGNVYYAELAATDISGPLHQSGVSGSAQVSLDYKPTARDSLHLDGNAQGASLTAQGTRSGTSAVNLSWKRKLTPHLNLTISASDIYNGGKVRTITRTASVSSVSYALNGGRVFFAGFSYRFGGAGA